jgi:hypothetical protein
VYTEKIRDNPFRNLWGGVPCSLEQKGFKPLSLTSSTWISSSNQQMAQGLEIIYKYSAILSSTKQTQPVKQIRLVKPWVLNAMFFGIFVS